ncbi:DUF1853 family protein [Acinetobacter sp. ANC 3926]|uniref:DUF1853 domain-containing protein n=1 Tax=Acinetobacter genomosp. 15BJ TaxID=106651 RepID=R9B5L8_9GAMM|nr:DUF1853 family protein [Acinetobacter genomosp. 15BJ]EOR09774.1 hypothetical protein F896_00796 [Acinetobacter genomosp. 15BJ]MCH7292329.1 DUF1853 family protein [Acinetobacter genomosp. 15BJ]
MPNLITTSSYFEPWLQFNNPIVRHLAFCVASPNILAQIPNDLDVKHHFELHHDSIWYTHYQNYEQRLKQLDQQPQPLIDFLAQLKSTRLGLRFENLLWFWLLDHDYHPYQLLGHSIQKITGSITLGELDFVVLNTRTNEIEHWEVALKYYLGENELDLAQWYGLNREDTLHRKLKHFTERQFQFSEANHHQIQRKFAVMKGQLYLPEEQNNLNLPSWINASRRLGHWGTYIPQTPYYRLQRHEWLCPDLEPSSQTAVWWSNGLYYQNQPTPSYYMFRQPSLLFMK